MFLPLLCLGTIQAPSGPASCQLSVSLPSSSGSVSVASFHPFSRSTTTPTPFCTVAPASSPSESGHGTRSLLSATLRPAQQRTPCLAARVAGANRRVRAQAVLPQPRGSCFQTCWFLRPLPRHRQKTVPEPFSYRARRFLHTRDRQRLHSLHRRGTHPVSGYLTRG
jgi:hypothetical protein